LMRVQVRVRSRSSVDNAAANPFVAPEILNDPAVYPPPAVESRLYIAEEASPTLERLRTRTWNRITTGL